MCLKYGRFQPKRAYKARAYKNKEVYLIHISGHGVPIASHGGKFKTTILLNYFVPLFCFRTQCFNCRAWWQI